MSPSSGRPSSYTRNNHKGNSCLALPRGSGSLRTNTQRGHRETPCPRWEMDSRCLRPQGAPLIRVKECCICWDGISRDSRSTREHFTPGWQHRQANRQEVSQMSPLWGLQLTNEGLEQHSHPHWNITMSCTTSLPPGLCSSCTRSQPVHGISAQCGHGQLNPSLAWACTCLENFCQHVGKTQDFSVCSHSTAQSELHLPLIHTVCVNILVFLQEKHWSESTPGQAGAPPHHLCAPRA